MVSFQCCDPKLWSPGIAMRLISLNVARPRLAVYEDRTVSTGIFKQPVFGPVRLRSLNLDGDRQADLAVH